MTDSISDLLEMGSQAFDRGDFHSAAGYYQQAAGLAHQEGNVDAELRGWNMAARSWANAGEIQKSIEAASALLTRAREEGNRYHQVNAARLLASRMAALDVRNRWREIRPLLLEGLELARQLGEQGEVVEHLTRLGECAVDVNDPEAGLDWLQKAEQECNSLSNAKSQLFYRYLIYKAHSRLRLRRSDFAEAVRYAEMAVGAAQENGNPIFVASAQLALARAERARGERADALLLVEEVLPQARQMKWKDTEQEAEYLRGELLREMGRSEEAEPAARRALELAWEMKIKEEEVECLLSLGQVLLALGQRDEARDVLAQARRLSQERDYADHFQKAEELLAGLS